MTRRDLFTWWRRRTAAAPPIAQVVPPTPIDANTDAFSLEAFYAARVEERSDDLRTMPRGVRPSHPEGRR